MNAAEEGNQGNAPKNQNNGWHPADHLVVRSEIEPWPEPVDGQALLDELARTVQRFVVLPRWAGEAVVLWIVHTYAFTLRGVATYLGVESPEPRCGKSTLLDVLGLLVNRPVRTANISPSAFFRVIHELQPTLLIDEADTFLYSEELRGILNAGYQRKGGYVMRVTYEVSSAHDLPGDPKAGGAPPVHGGGSGGRGQLAKFSCWCPKAIARIGRLPHTLADRCIVLGMQRKLPSESCERLRDLEGERLGRQCARFVRDHAEEIRRARPTLPEGLNDRAADIWEPLLLLADLAGGDWPSRARQAAKALTVGAQHEDQIGTLFADICEYFAVNGKPQMFTQGLVDWLNLSEARPWHSMTGSGKVTAKWLALQLQVFGVRPKIMRIEGRRANGYDVGDLAEVFRRYIPEAEPDALQEELNQHSEVEEARKAETSPETGESPAA